MSRHGSYDDWNHLYENEWPTPSFTYSKKWEWHYRGTPYIKYVAITTLPIRTEDRPYKRSGPYSSTMYRKFTAEQFGYSGYVNNLGDL